MPPLRIFGAASVLSALLVLALVPAAGGVAATGRLQVIHLDVGQGDGALIISPLGQVVLIDEGPAGVNPAMGKSVVQQLQALGVTRVDHHFASHYHADHIGNITAIVNAGIPIDVGWDRGGSYTTATYTNYVNVLGNRRRTLVKGQTVTLDSLSAHPVTIRCVDLAGAGIGTTDENALSLVLKVSYGEFDQVMGGDLPGSGPDVESVVGPQVGPVEVYKVHHHGSRYSSNVNWLNAVSPKIGVISVGNGNSYGHPTADALTRLHNKGVRTYWTETGAGVAPNPAWDRVANGQVVISATWEPAGVDTVRGPGFADTFTNSGTADTSPPLVALTAPDGGESWVAGSMQAITWTATDDAGVETVDLDYSLGGAAGPWLTIAHGLANSGSHPWTVPSAVSDSVLVRVTAVDAAQNSASDLSDSVFSIGTPYVAVAGPAGTLALASPAPNPGCGATTLRFVLPQAGRARLEIVDLAGRRVWLDEAELPAGAHARRWDGETANGSHAPAGLYFVRLVTPFGSRATRLVWLQR